MQLHDFFFVRKVPVDAQRKMYEKRWVGLGEVGVVFHGWEIQRKGPGGFARRHCAKGPRKSCFFFCYINILFFCDVSLGGLTWQKTHSKSWFCRGYHEHVGCGDSIKGDSPRLGSVEKKGPGLVV